MKFRVWNKAKKEMFYSTSGSEGSNGEVNYVNIWTGYEDWSETANYSELMQSIGLYDKNDIEIFEGDLVKYATNSPDDNMNWSNSAEVIWDKEEARFCIKENSHLLGFIYRSYEIVGNIFQNEL